MSHLTYLQAALIGLLQGVCELFPSPALVTASSTRP
jgi:hypothetical protein